MTHTSSYACDFFFRKSGGLLVDPLWAENSGEVGEECLAFRIHCVVQPDLSHGEGRIKNLQWEDICLKLTLGLMVLGYC